MMAPQDLIWILDSDSQCVSLYQQTLGLQYGIRTFNRLGEFSEACSQMNDLIPRLLIADPATIDGSLSQFLNTRKENASSATEGALTLPEVVIVTSVDDLDLIRFYLKTGVRDYLLKPIRPNELVAKVERALTAANNREILILRNDLDGIQVNDLTFREHQLLTLFLSRKDRRVSRDDLYDAIWSKVTVNRKTLDVHLFNLRRKIRPHGYDIICKDQIFSLQRA
jgi:DNA-binding response OmpR family regulator